MKWIGFLSIIFFMACSNGIPDQDAVINVDVSLDTAHRYYNINCSKAYDTILSDLHCTLSLVTNNPVQDKEIYLFQENKLIDKGKTKQGVWHTKWIKGGIYSIQVGNADTYPCMILRNIQVIDGRGCDVEIKLPKN